MIAHQRHREQDLLLPGIILLPLLCVAVLYPIASVSIAMLFALLFFGLRYPVATAGIVLVAIPIIDQAIAEKEFTELFGAFRITPAVVLKAMMALVIGSYLIRNRINPLRFRTIRPILVWLLYTLITCFMFHDPGLALSMWLRLAYWVFYFVFFYVVAANGAERHKSLWLWRAGVLAVAIFAGSVHLAKAMGIGGEYYKVGESYGFYADPWNMSMTLPGGLVLVLLYPCISGDKRLRTRLGCTLLAFATVLASFFTFTRTSLIACLIATMVFAFALRYVSKTRATKVLAALALVFVVAAVLFVYRNLTSTTRGNQVSARWSEVEKGSIGSGRLEVFYAAWTRFATASKFRQIVGHGIGAGPEAAEEFMGVYVYLHDDFLEMLVCAGLIGLMLYLRFFWRLYRDILGGLISRNIWAVAALASMAVYSLTSISYMRIYAVTPNTYFALAAGTSLGMLHAASNTSQDAGAHQLQI